MKLSIQPGSENYVCTVVQIDNLNPIEGADKIQTTSIFGSTVIISKDVKIGDKMLYFTSGTQLSPDFTSANNLFTNKDKNVDTNKKGYIGKNRLVRIVKLRGVYSDGILLSLEAISGLNVGIKVGDTFTDIDNVNICKKYIIPVQTAGERTSGKNGKPIKRFDKIITEQFEFHGNTSHLAKNLHALNLYDKIGIHYKKHGTSAIYANIQVNRQLPWYERLLQKIGVNINATNYDLIYSSRQVIKNQYITESKNAGYYATDVWKYVKDTWKLDEIIPKNWIIYGEILGYVPGTQTFIQKGFDYKCDVGECDFYVYKIAIKNPDGKTIYLDDLQIREWCNEVGLKYADTLLYYGTIMEFIVRYSQLTPAKIKKLIDKFAQGDNEIFDLFFQICKDRYLENDCHMCNNNVPAEGIVVRVNKLNYYEAYKLKSNRFKEYENGQLDAGESDIESEN